MEHSGGAASSLQDHSDGVDVSYLDAESARAGEFTRGHIEERGGLTTYTDEGASLVPELVHNATTSAKLVVTTRHRAILSAVETKWPTSSLITLKYFGSPAHTR